MWKTTATNAVKQKACIKEMLILDFLNMKKSIETLFKNKRVIAITENDEKFGGKLICKPDGTFAVKKFNGKEQKLWLSSMRFIEFDGFEVTKCKSADGSSSILLEKELPNEVRETILELPEGTPIRIIFQELLMQQSRSDYYEMQMEQQEKKMNIL